MKINNYGIAALLLALPIVLTAGGELPPAADITVDFDQHVRPLLAAKCHSCHGEKQQQAGLRLDKRQNALRGGDYGPVIVRGNGAESKLIKKLVGGDGGMQMPPTGPLEAEQIGVLRAWIDQGAVFGDVAFEVAAPRKPVDPKVQELIDAVRKHDIASVKALLKDAPDTGQWPGRRRFSASFTMLPGFGTLETMKLLIDAGAEVDARNDRNSTPLHWAVSDGAKVRQLLENGADINAKTERQRTPLSLAAAMLFDIAPVEARFGQRRQPEHRQHRRADTFDVRRPRWQFGSDGIAAGEEGRSAGRCRERSCSTDGRCREPQRRSRQAVARAWRRMWMPRRSAT